MSETTGVKYDRDKPRTDLMQPRALLAYARVLGFGAKKYAPHNWRLVPDARMRYAGAALRHVLAYLTGETRDPETNENHMAHAMCCVAFVLELDEEGSDEARRTSVTDTAATGCGPRCDGEHVHDCQP